ncbi:hypothetical protein [Streptomyces acidiscabies]|uniref:Uncharacterized protein n=1 Tax=Streptomyces acidiscabies TaxID=42234 RepID=A0AAP6EIC6_9ACTN|nr:hypothetical protein [Streptomyces acidiscabies]MDX2963335.1 hypothetical protein [Streptomyces acidiscabies]MDX3023069.1 hypothetical protein [Streptomyces acidiscabies]MDX3792787.1 hypothetical protein [Streptomyces acidiscabies]GAQ51263.1 hypothetical protein a10_01043 [Streptomyces acidiscabies]
MSFVTLPGGLAEGFVVGGVGGARVNMNLRRRLDLVMILAPFTAYLLAELIHASGVLAVVVTLVVQGLLLPGVVRWARLPRDTSVDEEQILAGTLATVRARSAGTGDSPALLRNRHYTDLRLALIATKRATVVRLRDEARIDDTVLRRLQATLDNEEVRLAGGEQAE